MEDLNNCKRMMENESDEDSDEESGRFSEAFVCCICRDLLYKPVVLACGHISCFWCVHKSMSGLQKSRCPICRNQYFHFPYICQTLHLLLLKLYPSAYNRREKQILEEEKDIGYFSPQINGPSSDKSQTEATVINPLDASRPCFSEADRLMNPCSLRPRETQEMIMQEAVQSGSVHPETGLKISLDRRKDMVKINSNAHCKSVSVADILCGFCKRMLFRPIVLNCGHAFCACCIFLQTNGIHKCEVCESPQPGDIPKVCLEFDHFLEEQFPKEYELRRVDLQMKQEQLMSDTPNTCSSEEDPLPWWNASSKVHVGVGCDACGMYPIIGDRYRCRDCVEQIGYDLCQDCYSTSSKLPGRFNQQHTSDHKFEFVKSNVMHSIMLRLLRGRLQEVSAVSDAVNDSSANMIPFSDDANEDEENAFDAHLNSSGTDPNQRENERSG